MESEKIDLKNIETYRIEGITVEAGKIAQVNVNPRLVIQNINEYGNRLHYNQDSYNPALVQKFPNTHIQNFFDSLKESYKNRYRQKLDRHFEIDLKINRTWNTQTLNENNAESTQGGDQTDAIGVIKEVFLQKRRMLIVGNPGAGKTVLLLRLAISLLENCDPSKNDWAFPVIFNLASWSDKYKSFEDWLIEMLSVSGLSKSFAKNLLDDDRLILLLDGLDELARKEDEKFANETRAKCMRSLEKYIKRKREYVICSRRNEFTAMHELTGQDAPVNAKVEVSDLTSDDVKAALMSAKEKNYAASDKILKIIETNQAFLEILKTPFYFTTAFIVFDSADEEYMEDLASEKRYRDVVFLKSQIIHEFLEVKLVKEGGHYYFDNISFFNNFSILNRKNKNNWLFYLAVLMEKRQVVTFELADLQTYDLQSVFVPWWLNNNIIFTIFSGLIGALTILIFKFISHFSINYALYGAFSQNLSNASRLVQLDFLSTTGKGFVIGMILGLITSLVSKGFKNGNSSLTNWDLLRGEDPYPYYVSRYPSYSNSDDDGWGCGCVLPLLLMFVNFFIGGIYTYFSDDPPRNIFGMVFLLCIFIMGFWWLRGISRETNFITQKFAALKTPYQRFRMSTLRNILAITLAAILPYLISISVSKSHLRGNRIDFFYTSFFISFVAALLLIITLPLYKHLILRLCMFLSGSLPIRLAAFLNFATKENILEKDGGFWRFRHQNIQEFLGSGIEHEDGKWQIRRKIKQI